MNNFDNSPQNEGAENQGTSEPKQDTTPKETTDTTNDSGSNEGSDQGVDIPEKFKGKSKEDIIKSYTNLEKKLSSKGESKAQEAKQKQQEIQRKRAQGDKAGARKALREFKDIKKELINEVSDMDMKGMNPNKFAKLILEKSAKLSEHATKQARREYEVREKVGKEIKEAKKDYPILGKNTPRANEFKEAVVNKVKARKEAGNPISLKEACEKVSTLMNNNDNEENEEKEEKEDKKKKQPKDVEKPTGRVGNKVDKSEEDKVKDGIMNAGAGRNKSLGGL